MNIVGGFRRTHRHRAVTAKGSQQRLPEAVRDVPPPSNARIRIGHDGGPTVGPPHQDWIGQGGDEVTTNVGWSMNWTMIPPGSSPTRFGLGCRPRHIGVCSAPVPTSTRRSPARGASSGPMRRHRRAGRLRTSRVRRRQLRLLGRCLRDRCSPGQGARQTARQADDRRRARTRL